MISELATEIGNLPAEPNSFIGRERDLTELAAILGRVRALTLCGPGGVGQTRRALRLGAGLRAQYPGGVVVAAPSHADLHHPPPPPPPVHPMTPTPPQPPPPPA